VAEPIGFGLIVNIAAADCIQNKCNLKVQKLLHHNYRLLMLPLKSVAAVAPDMFTLFFSMRLKRSPPAFAYY
jgi:hypothetical protein